MESLSRLVPCVAVLAAMACSKAEPPTVSAAPTTTPPAAATTAAPATPSAPPSAAAPDKPRSAPLGTTADDALGVVPTDLGVEVGTPAPDATVADAEGKPVALKDLYARGPQLVVFYRGGWCPFCNTQMRALSESFAELGKLGVGVIAISVDRVDEAAKTSASWSIPFPVLSDPDLVAHKAFRVTHEVPAAEFAKLSGYGIDLEKASGRAHHTIAVPSLFLVDAAGVVRWAHADPDYKVRPSVPQILQVIGRVLPKSP